MEAYHAEKLRLFKTIGFTEASVEAAFALAEGLADTDLVALMLGERDSLPIEKFIVTEERFGLSKAKAGPTSAILSVSPEPVGKCTVVFNDARHHFRAIFNCDLYVPGIPDLRREAFRARIRCSFFSFSFGFETFNEKITLNLDWDKALEWQDLKGVTALIEVMQSGSGEMKIIVNGNMLVEARLHGSNQVGLTEKDQKKSETIRLAVITLDEAFSLPELAASVKLTYRQLTLSANNLIVFGYLLDRDRTTRARLVTNIDADVDFTNPATRMIYPIQISFTEIIFVAVLELSGSATVATGECTFDIHRSRLIGSGVVRSINDVKALAASIRARADPEREGELLLIHDELSAD